MTTKSDTKYKNQVFQKLTQSNNDNQNKPFKIKDTIHITMIGSFI